MISSGSLQERLRRFHSQLIRAAFKPEHHLSEEVRDDFAELVENLGRAEGLVSDEAFVLACRVRDMAGDVNRAHYEWIYRPRWAAPARRRAVLSATFAHSVAAA